MSSTSPCFLKKPAFCPSSENEFSQVPARPPAIRNRSCAVAAEPRPSSSANAAITNLHFTADIRYSVERRCRRYPPPRVSGKPVRMRQNGRCLFPARQDLAEFGVLEHRHDPELHQVAPHQREFRQRP